MELESPTIIFNGVNFQYDLNGPLILKNINVIIPKGKTVAIVGGSGSGKTTLMKLMLKYHNPTEGSITINKDINLANISSKWWWMHCGTVMQDGFIFSDSVENNIASSNEGVDIIKMQFAKKVANISDFIESMSSKGNTLIGASGVGLSGGQKQRVLIARAVYKEPNILFFDEATSSLDAENEEIIMENIEKNFKGKTKIIIAHRFSTIKNADKIIVLDQGEIIEEGTHAELLGKNGKYKKLFSNQLTTIQLTADIN